MKKIVLIIFFIMLAFSIEEVKAVGNKAEIAKNLVMEAGKFAKKVGKKKAIEEFNKADGKFTRGEFYIFALDMNGVTLANYKAKRLIGKNIYNLRDLNRTYFIRKFIEVAKNGSGWVTYYWKHPLKRRIMKKRSYILRVDKDYFIGCGYYVSREKHSASIHTTK